MTTAPDGQYRWLEQPGGPIDVVLLDAANVDYPIITSANDNVGNTIGKFTAISDNPDDTFVYTLVGNPDGKFVIDGDLLKVQVCFNYNQAETHSLTVRATDQNGYFLDITFVLTVDESVGGPDITNVVVSFVAQEGEGLLDEAEVGVIHNITLVPLRNIDFGMNSYYGLQQVHVVLLDDLVGEGVLAEMTIGEPPTVINGEGVLDTMDILQIHNLVLASPTFNTQYVLPGMMLNPIFLNPLMGYGQLGDTLSVTSTGNAVSLVAQVGHAQMGTMNIVEIVNIVDGAPDLVGEGVLDEMDAAELVPLNDLNGSSSLDDLSTSQSALLTDVEGEGVLDTMELEQEHVLTFVSVNGSSDLDTMAVTVLP